MPVLQRVSVSVKNILLASDFSSASDKAAAYAKALALNFRSSVEIAHVFDPSVVTSYMEAVLGLPVKERQHISNEALERLQREFTAAGIEAHTSLPEGHRPHVALLKLALEHDTDLIVGPQAQQPANGPLVFQKIIYATDFSAEAAKAAVFALSFAQDSGAHLYYCFVARSQDTPAERTAQDAAFQATLRKMIPESSYEWCSPETVVEHGNAAKSILDLADRVHADLIVLGARNASFWLTHVEHGLTPDLLAEAKCPVMTVC